MSYHKIVFMFSLYSAEDQKQRILRSCIQLPMTPHNIPPGEHLSFPSQLPGYPRLRTWFHESRARNSIRISHWFTTDSWASKVFVVDGQQRLCLARWSHELGWWFTMAFGLLFSSQWWGYLYFSTFHSICTYNHTQYIFSFNSISSRAHIYVYIYIYTYT